MVEKMKERLVSHDDMADELRRVQQLNAEHLLKIDSLQRYVNCNCCNGEYDSILDEIVVRRNKQSQKFS